MRLKVSSAKRRPFCPGLNVLIYVIWTSTIVNVKRKYWYICHRNICIFTFIAEKLTFARYLLQFTDIEALKYNAKEFMSCEKYLIFKIGRIIADMIYQFRILYFSNILLVKNSVFESSYFYISYEMFLEFMFSEYINNILLSLCPYTNSICLLPQAYFYADALSIYICQIFRICFCSHDINQRH